jgi:hypothetical protein
MPLIACASRPSTAILPLRAGPQARLAVHLLFAAIAMCALALSGCGSSGAQGGSNTGAASSSAGSPTAISGYVAQIDPNGDFILDTGTVRFTVVMSPSTTVVNVRGRQVPRQFISVAGPAKVTGTVTGSRIAADSVVLPTRKDDP